MKDYQYLVITHWEDDPEGETTSRIMSAKQIFDMMDMEDCFPCRLEMDIWRINEIGEALTDCAFFGPWHDGEDPLKMCIVGDGIREIGYGTDH